MSRLILTEDAIHPSIRDRVEGYHHTTIKEVSEALASHKIVVVGMAQNPHCKRAKKMLDASSLPFFYLEYGSYFGGWKQRLGLKMWTGWSTFPMVFVDGQLIGGANELSAMIEEGALKATPAS